ncbi:hypothetical protein [Sphingomonas sp. OTU376]|uniref:hypothetical protein n=1 Tax=Sphingomonas sp. OTU376 TaxID=3043863 RepID=UPI00313B828A
MADGSTGDLWAALPGPKWETPLEARTWLVAQRRRLGWSHRDVEKAFLSCASHSDLYLGPGGGPLFDRATEKRVARFEQDGRHIPDWMYWMPLAIEHAAIPLEDQWRWEREYIPSNSEVRRDREEQDLEAHLLELDDEEIALIARIREMTGDERAVVRAMVRPEMLRWWIDCLKRAQERGTPLFELIDKALS